MPVERKGLYAGIIDGMDNVARVSNLPHPDLSVCELAIRSFNNSSPFFILSIYSSVLSLSIHFPFNASSLFSPLFILLLSSRSRGLTLPPVSLSFLTPISPDPHSHIPSYLTPIPSFLSPIHASLAVNLSAVFASSSRLPPWRGGTKGRLRGTITLSWSLHKGLHWSKGCGDLRQRVPALGDLCWEDDAETWREMKWARKGMEGGTVGKMRCWKGYLGDAQEQTTLSLYTGNVILAVAVLFLLWVLCNSHYHACKRIYIRVELEWN